ncbi:Csm1 domain-containing protein [Trichophyton interdigitale]|uniref:Csm1 domain-containing protein n=2 Tax=Trichophyton interdigitale TaxID=101480 RepID=A0A9P4YN93_9EURO|nr:hypothetical protein H101_02396 [Trichophyton interdigitale H6]KAF3899471.1 Csm1 domain-containing protein [Trichophyton interdigitale]KAF3900858.1 Csm1 domain-containing protein [Trichophyton interdigitale]KAG8211805.1 Csm1 domain-containing protein [Trichophyton interdigitale]KDB26026.1 hypothetical protein H109_02160 [Trichophyton interdigitale MR816]
MPKRKAESKLSSLVNGEIEDDDLSRVEDDDNASIEPPPAKRQKGRPKAATTKTTTAATKTTRKTRSKVVVGPKKRSSAAGRKKAAKVVEEPPAEDVDSVEEENETLGREGVSEDELDSPETVQNQESQEKTRTRGRAKDTETIRDGEFEYTPTNTKSAATRGQKGKQTTKQAAKEPSPPVEITPETVKSAPRTSISASKTQRFTPSGVRWASPVKSTNVLPQHRSSRPSGIKPWGSPTKGREAGDGEVALRLKLGEMTKKYESMEGKYRALREIGIVEANSNLEKIRKQHEETTTASKQLINSLKSELSKQSSASKQTRDLQKQLESRNEEVAQLRQQLEEMKSGLNKAQTEAKSLQTKLTAARNAAANAEKVATARGSGVRPGAVTRDTANGLLESAQVAQLKEDLYSDLTGLIIRDVKKRESDHLYDCIQTGLNGTLHFKLGVSHNMDNRSTASLEAAEFHYIPLLDENRDRDLLEILPDYLSVDITFSRQHAATFYSRVVDRLTKKLTDS